MRIKQISVTNLFGMFDHVIPLNLEEGITIIHGANGFGKTALLRLVKGFFNSRYSELRAIPFSEFRIDFDDSTYVIVTNKPEQSSEGSKNEKSRVKLDFEYYRSKVNHESYSPIHQVDRLPPSVLEREIPGLERLGQDAWMYLPTSEVFSLEEVLDRFPTVFPKRMVKDKSEPDWLKEIKETVQVRFVETQRLLNLLAYRSQRLYNERSSSTSVQVVSTYSQELAETIQARKAESDELSQSLDRTFPARLVARNGTPNLTSAEIQEQLKSYEVKRSQLMQTGLLDKTNDEFQPPEQIDESNRRVLSVYIEDTQKKLSVFDEISQKIELFREIVNERFLYKEMSITRDKGFIFTNVNGKILSPEDLSSGEQHELVLFYELLFKIDAGSLILIDEPELSLHVAWQVKFLEDLQRVIGLNPFYALIATHSPQIINDRWDLTVALKGPNE